jgi:hypothetical protein
MGVRSHPMVMWLLEVGLTPHAIRHFAEHFFPLTFKGNSTISLLRGNDVPLSLILQ